MKTIYTIILVLFLASVVSSANAGNKVKDIRQYKTELNLTAQQMQQINTIYDNAQARVRLQAPATTPEQKAQQRFAANKQRRDEIRRILTPEQKRQYRKIMGIEPKQKK